jgi:hypothetical protein
MSNKRCRAPQQFKHQIIGVIDPGDECGFVYTVGLHPQASELAAIDVPRADMADLAELINFLSGRVVTDNQTAQSRKKHVYYIRAPPDELQHGFKLQSCPLMDPHANVLFLHRP